MDVDKQLICPSCGVFLIEPYIKCSECKLPQCFLCLKCFAKGREFGNHQNNHSYEILRTNFSLLESHWTAAEELRLLDAVLESGIGNWSDVAQKMRSKSKEECKSHYFNKYIFNPSPPLPAVPEPQGVSEVHATPFLYKSCEDPPRPNLDSLMYNEMAGYMPARGDFNTEFDNFAEMDAKFLDFADGDQSILWRKLQVSALKIYCSRLKERARRKYIIKTYGLIHQRRAVQSWRRYESLNKTILDKIVVFARLMPAQEFDFFMEGLLCEHEMKQHIHLLQECHREGIRRLHSIGTYLNLKKNRDDHHKRTLLSEVLNHLKDDVSGQQWLRKQILKENSQGLPEGALTSGRRPAPPLNIMGMPSFEKLTDKEKELCSSLRLFPEAYLTFRRLLISECRKLGGLKLGSARSLVKIDVNKTRKIYDLLLEDGLIYKGDN